MLLSNIEVLRGSFSITPLLDYLQESGYYDLIQEIKNVFGDDVAIDICKELTNSNDCEIVVRTYMITTAPPNPYNDGEEPHYIPAYISPEVEEKILEYIKTYYPSKYEKMKDLILLILSYYYNLIKNMNDQEIIDFIKRIMNNPLLFRHLFLLINQEQKIEFVLNE